MVNQLLGKGRQYYSVSSMNGAGTYTAAAGRQENSNIKKGKDSEASSNSWTYGSSAGSVQFTCTLNEQAQVIEKAQLKEIALEIGKKFPESCNFMIGKFHGDAWSIIAAMLGYNVVRETNAQAPQGINVDYYCITDRKALSIASTVEIRKEEAFQTDPPKEIKKYRLNKDLGNVGYIDKMINDLEHSSTIEGK